MDPKDQQVYTKYDHVFLHMVLVEEFVKGFFKEGTVEITADSTKPSPDTVQLPPWYDEKKYNQGRRYFHDNRASLVTQQLFGLIAVFAVPTILNVLVGTHRSNSVYTSYKRYQATFPLIISWLEYELKPGSIGWRSMQVVRMRHFKASKSQKFKGIGVVSQRDMAITLYGLIGYSLLRPGAVGVRERQPGDLEAYIHTWRVIAYMIGISESFNPCRESVKETLQIFEVIEKRVYIPLLENVPEHFEHMARVTLDGMWNIHFVSETSAIWFTKWLSGVPGYVYFEHERIALQDLMREKLKGKSLDSPVATTELMEKCAVEGLPDSPPRYLYLKDFDTLDSVPSYKQLSWYEKRKIDLNMIIFFLSNYSIFGFFLTLYFDYAYFMMKYFPWYASLKYGFKAFSNIFREVPTDSSYPVPNEVFYNKEKAKNDKDTVKALKKAGLTL